MVIINCKIQKMTRYSVQRRDRKFVKSYRFLLITKNIGAIIGNRVNENLNSK